MMHYDYAGFYETELFHDVQMQGIFVDSKTFADSNPKIPLSNIHLLYNELSDKSEFCLETFIDHHFHLPCDAELDDSEQYELSSLDMIPHCEKVLEYNRRQPHADENTGSLIGLPYPYVQPGGRFREIYYWDTYFTAEGLAAIGRLDDVKSMIQNLGRMIESFGYIPNGNRTYYLDRSQPPAFALLLNILERHDGIEAVTPYISQLEAEYGFWMDGEETVNKTPFSASRRVVCIEPGVVLNRYYSDSSAPRPESYKEDIEAFAAYKQAMQAQGFNVDQQQEQFYREIRASAESGWDFSSRWIDKRNGVSHFRTTEMIPVDLNALLYFMEVQLSHYHKWLGHDDSSKRYREAAERRKRALETYCWDNKKKIFSDYCWVESRDQGKIVHNDFDTLATVVPLFVNLCDADTAAAIAETLKKFFISCDVKGGGLAITLMKKEPGHQWDTPNAWPPYQWMAVQGLKNYGLSLADTIQREWLKLNHTHYRLERKMVEKYDVTTATAGGGGEYQVQDGFGWTNAIAICFDRDITMTAPRLCSATYNA